MLSEIDRKYHGNALNGYRQGVLEGGFTAFTGFPEGLKNRFGITLKFNYDSSYRFFQFAENIEYGVASTDACLVLAGRDYPIHSTVLEFQSETPIDQAITKRLQEAVDGNTAIKRLGGLQITYDYVFVDRGGSFVIAARNIPKEVLSARDELTKIATEAKLKPLPLTNILHISVARPLRLPRRFVSNTVRSNPFSNEQLARFDYYRASGIRPALRQEPLVLTVDTIVGDVTWNFLNSLSSLPLTRAENS